MLITKEVTFDSAHFLTDYYGKCERMHGHTYSLQVTLEGEIQKNGMVIDFALLKQIIKNRILNKLDHQLLNDVIENPSTERVAVWIWDQLCDMKKILKAEAGDPNMDQNIRKMLQKNHFEKTMRLYEIKLCETAGSCVTYRGQ